MLQVAGTLFLKPSFQEESCPVMKTHGNRTGQYRVLIPCSPRWAAAVPGPFGKRFLIIQHLKAKADADIIVQWLANGQRTLTAERIWPEQNDWPLMKRTVLLSIPRPVVTNPLTEVISIIRRQHRMPAILSKGTREKWLDSSDLQKAECYFFA